MPVYIYDKSHRSLPAIVHTELFVSESWFPLIPEYKMKKY